MAKIKLGMMNCFAAKRWPEPEVWCRIIGEDLGLRYAQFSLDLLDPRTSLKTRNKVCRQTVEAAQKYDMHITSVFTGLASYSFSLLLHPDPGMRADALRWYEEAIELATTMEVDGIGGHVGALSMQDFQNENRRRYLIQFLMDAVQYLSQVAKEARQKYLLWEPMPLRREPPCTIDQAKRFYQRVNRNAAVPVKFCLDLGHQCTVGINEEDSNPYEWLRQLAPYSPVIHIQQTDGQGDHHWPFTEEYNSKGIIHPDKVIRAIDESNAEEVVLLFEIIHPFEESEKKVFKDLKESVEYWRKWVKE